MKKTFKSFKIHHKRDMPITSNTCKQIKNIFLMVPNNYNKKIYMQIHIKKLEYHTTS